MPVGIDDCCAAGYLGIEVASVSFYHSEPEPNEYFDLKVQNLYSDGRESGLHTFLSASIRSLDKGTFT